jgi:tetratricopeptide (TPR) repeat protein
MDRKELNAKLTRSKSHGEKISLLDSYAGKLLERGKYGEAAKYYAKAFEIASLRNTKAYFSGQVGICHYTAGNDQKALQYLLKSARLFAPDKPEFMPDMCGFVYFHLGSLFEYHGRQAKSLEARKVCEQYADSQEKDTKWMLYAGISRTYEAMGRHDDAIQYSQKALQVLSDNDPGLTYIYESMGNNYMNMKQYQEAITYFSKVTELDPHFERLDEIQFKMADCYRQLTNDRMALETYKKMIELKHLTGKKEGLIRLYILKAECYFRLEEYEKSLIVTLEAVRRQPRNKLEKSVASLPITIMSSGVMWRLCAKVRRPSLWASVSTTITFFTSAWRSVITSWEIRRLLRDIEHFAKNYFPQTAGTHTWQNWHKSSGWEAPGREGKTPLPNSGNAC